eukprot:gene3286-7545_t
MPQQQGLSSFAVQVVFEHAGGKTVVLRGDDVKSVRHGDCITVECNPTVPALSSALEGYAGRCPYKVTRKGVLQGELSHITLERGDLVTLLDTVKDAPKVYAYWDVSKESRRQDRAPGEWTDAQKDAFQRKLDAQLGPDRIDGGKRPMRIEKCCVHIATQASLEQLEARWEVLKGDDKGDDKGGDSGSDSDSGSDGEDDGVPRQLHCSGFEQERFRGEYVYIML